MIGARLATFELWIPGRPKTKDRPRAAVGKKTGKPFMYTTQKTAQEEAVIREFGYQFRERQGWVDLHKGPIAMRAYFLVEKPGNWFAGREPDSMNYGDLDNLLKTVKDGLNGTVYKDDSQIVEYGFVKKLFWDFPGLLVVLDFFETSVPPPKMDGRRKKA